MSPPLPAGTMGPNTVRTSAGALAMHKGALSIAHTGFVYFLMATGRLTDELMTVSSLSPQNTGGGPDVRNFDRGPGDFQDQYTYTALHGIRNTTSLAIIALERYAPDSPPALRGELFAWQGFSEVMLAEMYCSGIPLSTVDFDGDWTYRAGSADSVVFRHAITLFDTAIVLSRDSAYVNYFARIGKARALVGLGEFAEAAQVVADVPNGYRYTILNPSTISDATEWRMLKSDNTISDREGGNGLPFRSSKDPRSLVHSRAKQQFWIDSQYVAVKYDIPIPNGIVADAIEARLIAAEADLRASGTQWLTMLNALRTDGTFTVSSPNPSGDVDTLWHAGTGGVDGLRPLRDPALDHIPAGKAASDVRIDLLFAERGYWMFLTGHHQGDLRRLVRYDRRNSETVYPTGRYGFSLTYGRDVVVPVPESEQQLNPSYRGCLDRNA